MPSKSTTLSRRSHACLLILTPLLFGAVFYANIAIAETTTSAPTIRPAESRDVDPARSGRVAFTHFTDRNGLPQNAIQAIAFDRRGYLWVGTQDGAAYYNG